MTGEQHRSGRSLATAALLATLGLTASCAGLRGPESSAGSTPGTTRYSVEGLSFEVPSSWYADGSRRAVRLTHPGDLAVLDVSALQERFPDEKRCLEAATASLARGDKNFENVRRHPSSFAGRPAVAQEADQRGWHGWAWAVCDGGTQYRAFFSGRSPVQAEVIDAWRTFTRSATLPPR